MTYNPRFRRAMPEDLPRAADIEARSFLPEEAATLETFTRRIKEYPEWFFVAEEDGQIVGLFDGATSKNDRLTDRMYEGEDLSPDGNTLMVFGLAAAPEARGRGIGKALLSFALEEARTHGLERVSLTCKKDMISYYERFGWKSLGASASRHGGAAWVDMTCGLKGPITEKEEYTP